MLLVLVLQSFLVLPYTNRHQNKPFKRWFSCLYSSHRVLPCTNRHQNQAYLTGVQLFVLMGVVLLAASCTSVYKQAPEQTYLTDLVVYVYGFGAFCRILYFRVHTGTKTNRFNGCLVVYVYGLGAFSRILYFCVQTGTKSNLFNRGFSCLCLRGLVPLAASCTSGYKQAPK